VPDSPDSNIPPDLIELQRKYDQALDECERIANELPSGVDVAAGRATFSDEDLQKLNTARAARDELGMKLHRHEWWATQKSRVEAKEKLRAAARGQDTEG
jgi:hypothetical protein